jgi:hypothetical protein
MRIVPLAVLVFGAFLFFFPLPAVAQNRNEASGESTAAKNFRAYLDADWKRWMELYPELATGVGYPGQNRRWADNSQRGIEARKRIWLQLLKS